MTEKERDELLISINEKLEKKEEQLQRRDNLLIALTREIALLRKDVKNKFEN